MTKPTQTNEEACAYKYWRLLEELPSGWKFDNTAGSPLYGYSFANNGISVLRGGERALVRVVPAQKQLFDAEMVR